jgi:aminopeptidase N
LSRMSTEVTCLRKFFPSRYHFQYLMSFAFHSWQAATHFKPFSARHAFPCFDSQQVKKKESEKTFL